MAGKSGHARRHVAIRCTPSRQFPLSVRRGILRERGEASVQFVDQQRAAGGRTQRVGSTTPVAHAPTRSQYAASGAIAKRTGRRCDRRRRGRKTADSAERLSDDCQFRIELGLIGDVLPRASAAGAIHRADRFDPRGAGFEQGFHAPSRIARPAIEYLDPNTVTRRGKRDEHDSTVGRAAHTVSARCEFVDLQLDSGFRAGGVRLASTAGYRAAPIS